MADPENANPKRTPWRAMLVVAVATAVAIWLVPTDDVQVVDLPTAPPQERAAVPTPAKSAGGAARELIAAQRSAGKPDPQAAYDKARALAKAGQGEDAYLLDFYAARLGHADAAFTLAEQADPTHWRAGGTLKAPAPAQALKWYRAAAEVGHPKAAERIAQLRSWAGAAAERGDAEAQRLMLAW